MSKKDSSMDDIEYLMEKITKAITFAFKEDGTVPGVTTAWLHHKKEFYTSIVRWSDGEKVVVCSFSNRVLLTALQGLAGKFLAAHKPSKSPVEELAEVIEAEYEPSKLPSKPFKPLIRNGEPVDDDFSFPVYND